MAKISLRTPGTSTLRRAASVISIHSVVREVSAGTVDVSDPSVPGQGIQAYGVATQGGQAGATLTVALSGDISEPTWSWTPGLPVFCGAGGVLTQTLDPTWSWLRIVGVATSSTSMTVRFQPPITLAS